MRTFLNVVGAALTVGALVLLWWVEDDSAEPPVGAVSPTARIAPAPVPAAPAPAAAAVPVATPAPAPSAPLSLSAQADAFAAGTPADAFRAYQMAQNCLAERNWAAQSIAAGRPSPAAAVCGDITPGQLASRMVWLERAAEAGVHGAAYAYAQEILHVSEPNIPVLPEERERYERYLKIGVQHGDKMALYTMSNRAEEQGDIVSALKWWVASTELYPLKSQATSDNVVNRLRRYLSPEQAASAIDAGKQFAAPLKGKS